MINFFVVLFAVICLYGIFKCHNLYKKYDDLRYIVFLSVLLLVFADVWISYYGGIVGELFGRYRFLFTLLPLLVYGFYAWADRKHRKENEEKRKIKAAFQQYLMPAVIEELLNDPSKLRLGGEKKNLAILFSDVRGFTTLSEKMTPEQLTSFLNEYLDHMTNIILENRGTVDKYIGDAIMAFWGAPIKDPEHIMLAVKTSVEMMEKMHELRRSWKTRGLPDIDIGIGINAGDVVVGNMGSHKRFDYTCLGDHVNLASRIEALNKMYGTHIIVSENVIKYVEKTYVCRELDLVTVKGKKEPVGIYEVVGRKADAKQKVFLKEYNTALGLYHARKFREAKKRFEAALDIVMDHHTQTYISRCTEYIKTPPPKDWNGVTEIKTK